MRSVMATYFIVAKRVAAARIAGQLPDAIPYPQIGAVWYRHGTSYSFGNLVIGRRWYFVPEHCMIRALALIGFGGGFLVISPPFRMTVLTGIGAAVNTLNYYSPLSYIALGILLVGSAAYSVYAPE